MKLKQTIKVVGQENRSDVDFDAERLIDKGLDQHERLENKRIDLIAKRLE